MSFEIKFTPEAEETYDLLVSQLSQRWGESFELKFQEKVLKTLKTLEQTPLIYSVIEEETDIRRCLLHKNCSMLYKIKSNIVLIVCFWDNRQDPLLNN